MFEINDPDRPDIDGLDLIIQKYPSFDSLANGQRLVFDAQKVGTIQGVLEDGTPAIGEVLELWDYWTPPVPTPEEIAAAKAAQDKAKADAKAKAAEQKKIGDARALQANQDAAAKGDAYGLMRMGERYRDGDGVEKDLAKAKEYLQKAADAGSTTAAEELSRLKQ
jgi:TPR repeat protein